MSDTDIIALVNMSYQNEKKYDRQFDELMDNFKLFWQESNTLFCHRLEEKKKEEQNCANLYLKIKNIKSEISNTNLNIRSIEVELHELNSRDQQIDSEIQEQCLEKQNLKEEWEKLQIKTNQMKKVYHILKANQSVYEQLGYNLVYNSSEDTFEFYCLGKENGDKGFVKFKYCEQNRKFNIIEMKEEIIQPALHNILRRLL